MKPNKRLRIIKNVLISVALPIIVFLIFQVLCNINGVTYVNSDNFKTLIVNIFYISFIAWGLSFNVPSGRFDFSVGSIIILSTIIGGNIALMLGLGAIGMLGCCILCGVILGSISGFLYTRLGLPAMVVSLGVALIYEAFTFILFDAKGVVMIGNSKMLYLIKQPYIYILGGVIFTLLIIVVNYTKFGYNFRSITFGQQIAVNTGINERKNTILCYAFCGGLVAISGVINLSRTGATSAALGLSTIMSMFAGFLPMFIGDVIGQYCERVTSIFIGAVTASLITTGLAAIGLSLSAQNIVGALILLGVLVYNMNSHKIREYKIKSSRRKQALINQNISV